MRNIDYCIFKKKKKTMHVNYKSAVKIFIKNNNMHKQ